MTSSDGGNEINDETRVSRTRPTATRNGYVRHAANKARSDTQHSNERNNLAPCRAEPDPNDRLRHQRKKDQERPLHNREQLDRVEVNALQVPACPGLSTDCWHYHWVEDLDDHLSNIWVTVVARP